MRSLRIHGWLLVAAAFMLSTARSEETGKTSAPLPGFVWVPPGKVQPGCTYKDYKRRATNGRLKEALIYEVWGSIKPFPLPGFYIGKYEVTNAQWKLYLDRNFREEYVTNGTETLPGLAERLVHVRGKGVASEWRAIYALNAQSIVAGWIKRNEAEAEKIAAGKMIPYWDSTWRIAAPPVDPEDATRDISKFFLPKGLKLTVYRCRVPLHWYGWCALSKLRVSREYVDPRLPPMDAFVVPDSPLFEKLKPQPLRAKDFARYPIRGISPNEMLAFAEWAGCELPSEYEFERAGRGDRPNSDPYTVPGPWKHNVDQRRYAFQGNKACKLGPLPVDDASVAGGDSSVCGARHLLGNIYELTRTFYDLHPKKTPKPPIPADDLSNYALVAKSGCYNDPWQFIQLSMRTPVIGLTPVTLQYDNRIDTLGFRLVRHTRPGYDLMLHSILRLSYDKGNADWYRPYPHAYAMPRMAGADETHIVAADAPYLHVQAKAAGIAFAPLWISDFNQTVRGKVAGEWSRGGRSLDGRSYTVLGAFRSDVALRVGRRMSNTEAEKLMKARKDYARALKAWKQASKKKRSLMKLPPKPPEADLYEELTKKKRKEVGLWREETLPPGEWVLVYWYGFVGLANKARVMPPDGIVAFADKRKDVTRRQAPAGRAVLRLDPAQDRIHLSFQVEEQPGDSRKRQAPPDEAHSDLWAISEVLPNGWYGRDPVKVCWEFDVTFKAVKGELGKHKWNQTTPGVPGEN